MTTPEPEERATRYQVCCLPEDHDAAFAMTITIEYRGRNRWAVLRRGYALSANGEWDYEPSASSRDDGWTAAHRFDLETARHLAKVAAPKLTVRGMTAADLLAMDVS